MRPPDRRYESPKSIQQQRSNKQAQALFRRIITNHMKIFVDTSGAKGSPAIVVGLVTQMADVVEGFGSRELNKNLPPDGDTLFGIGSISKVFTGLMLAKAVTDGDVCLSARANEWLDDTIQINDCITLKHLVTHFSGLPNFPDNVTTRDNGVKAMDTNELMPAKDYSKANLAKFLKANRCRPQNPPERRYLYSNLGIGLLSLALQNRYGFSDFNSMNQALITKVLKMDSTATNMPSFLEKYKTNLAQGYTARYKVLQPLPFSDMGILAGSGELISNVNDMNKLLKSLTGLSPGPLAAAVEESKRELAEAQEGTKIAYAQEIRRASDGGKIHFKTGLTAGFTAIMYWRDNPKIGMIILANRGKFRPLMFVSTRLFEVITRQLQARKLKHKF